MLRGTALLLAARLSLPAAAAASLSIIISPPHHPHAAATGADKIPLVVQLNGFCENAAPTAPMQVDYKPLINQDKFGWIQINAPKPARRWRA